MRKERIIVVVSSHYSKEENDKFYNHISNTIGVKHDIHIYENHNQYSLSVLYNKAIEEYHDDNAIMLFVHNDIVFETKDWGKNLLRHFNNPNTDYQIIGLAGSVEIPEHGCWYMRPDGKGMNQQSMRGIVNHDNGLRKWTSQYSEAKGGVDPVVTIDGLFMAVDTSDIEHTFDEDYYMWHYYDMGFCMPNYLDGCNIGVVYDIRVTHKSVGQTDQEWERNRQLFATNYKDDLPIYYTDPLDDGKLRILITCQFFQGYTGSEMSVFETARVLAKNGHEVHIISAMIGNPLYERALNEGITAVHDIRKPPIHLRNYFDIIHINHKPIGEAVLQYWNKVPAVMHVRSEVIPKIEEPIINDNIYRYISIRDTVDEYIRSFGIEQDKIIQIDNPFDSKRFNTDYKRKENKQKIVLFVGTMDYLRKNMLFDMKEKTKKDGHLLWIIGKDSSGYLSQLQDDHVEYFGVKKDVENYYKKADMTTGIFRGRTTIEGWLCGIPAWIYSVDNQGNIKDKVYVDVPKDVYKYTSDYYYDRLINLYHGRY